MVDFSAWATADPLTVEQAACLWAGIDPSSLSMRTQPQAEKAAIAPHLQMLIGAIVNRELRIDATNPLSALDSILAVVDYSEKSLVTRVDLMAFAKSRGERPAFLFDTMLKSVTKASKSDPEHQQKSKGGRPAEWDWNTFYLEIIRIANSPDGLPDTRAELAEIMRQWFIDQGDDHPAETTLEDRIRPIYQYMERHRKPASK